MINAQKIQERSEITISRDFARRIVASFDWLKQATKDDVKPISSSHFFDIFLSLRKEEPRNSSSSIFFLIVISTLRVKLL